MAKHKPITVGDRFEQVTVVEHAGFYVFGNGKGREPQWLVRCSCGIEKVVRDSSLKSGHTRSCGCLQRRAASIAGKKRATHGGRTSAEYYIWSGAKQRCTEHSKDRTNYNDRGIAMCERWTASFADFFADMGSRPSPDHSIDRIENDKGYWCGKAECPECGPAGRSPNCRWATRSEQQRNKRTNHLLTVNGTTLTIVEWASRTGLRKGTISERIRRGWTPGEAVAK